MPNSADDQKAAELDLDLLGRMYHPAAHNLMSCIPALIARVRKAELFKENTHILLDEAGVPQFETEDCRVSHRIRWIADRVRQAEREVKAWEQAVASVQEESGMLKSTVEIACKHIRSRRNAIAAEGATNA